MCSTEGQVRTAVILAAGRGGRIAHRSAVHPKAFIEIGGVPLIRRSIQILGGHGIERILVGTGYRAEWFEGLRESTPSLYCVRNPDFARSGSLHTLCLLGDTIDEDFLLLESDLIFERRAVQALLDIPFPDAVLLAGLTQLGDEVFVEADSNGCLQGLSKDPARRSVAAGVLVGISRLSLPTYRILCAHVARQKSQPTALDYEQGLPGICDQVRIPLLTIADLAWAEIDTEEHLKYVTAKDYPLIQARDESAVP